MSDALRSSGAAVRAAAERLRDAADTGIACAPVRELIGADDVDAAYAVQRHNVQDRLAAGSRVVGRKIGLTSEAVQRQLGVDQPDFGYLLDDMVFRTGQTIAFDRVLQPRAEAEVAFELRSDLTSGDLDHAQVSAAVRWVRPAIEVCGSRIAGWDISVADTVADNASAGVVVIGAERRTLAEVKPRDVAMRMRTTGQEDSTGTGADCLGDPLTALRWLALTARALGDPLRAGQIVLSGALGPMRPIAPGAQVTATISGLGTVSAPFGDLPPSTPHPPEGRR